jgi:Protein of unknown function (DUF2934)
MESHTYSPTRKPDSTARTEIPSQPFGEVERRERAIAQDKYQRPVIPPHTATDVEMSEYMDREEIAKLAYHYWLAREGRSRGSAEEDWLRAEQEFRRRSRSR